jgi:ribosomal silencing factor RsfS
MNSLKMLCQYVDTKYKLVGKKSVAGRGLLHGSWALDIKAIVIHYFRPYLQNPLETVSYSYFFSHI